MNFGKTPHDIYKLALCERERFCVSACFCARLLACMYVCLYVCIAQDYKYLLI